METSKSTRAIKREIFQGENLMTSVRNATGNKTRSRKGIMDAATEFYGKLYASTTDDREKQMEKYRNLKVK
jgi:hypothetical protein